MNIAICDDYIQDLQLLQEYCEMYNSGYTITTFSSAHKLYHACKTVNYDIILLDIEMDSPNGYEIAKKLKSDNYKALIIFTTNSLDYAIRGYGVAFCYLPKPISYKYFCETIKSAENLIIQKHIEITGNNHTNIVSIGKIIYFESFKHNIIFHLENNETIVGHGTLLEYIDKINSQSFVFIHKSYCINMKYISSTTTNTVILKNGISLPIGRSKKDNFFNELQKYIRSY